MKMILAAWLGMALAATALGNTPPEYRRIGTNIYNISTADNWDSFKNARIFSVESGGLVVQVNDHFLFITNAFGSGYAVDQIIRFAAHRSGTIKTSYGVLELWDCGVPCDPPPPTPEEIAAAKAAMEAQKATLAENKKKLDRAQAVAVKSLLADAQAGSASAQYSLAIHYLNGQGCETNRAEAVRWLKLASDAGDLTASNKLVALQLIKPPTPDPH